MLTFSNTYSALGDTFYQRTNPEPVSSPKLLLWNEPLAEQLGISLSDEDKTLFFSGNVVPEGAEPLAQAYAGHQFGQLNPQLGDGRAHLLGEVVDKHGQRFDIQLKGSGPTRFSRGGDGRSAIGPALREYIMSEAMYYLGVPTTRALAVVATGDTVYRDTLKPGAITTRVGASHIRVGTFVYFAIRDDKDSLQQLADYTIARHYPDIKDTAGNQAILLLQAAMAKQIELVTHWMRVGFIHGVMNTDNTAISGETIDYGPCAMMGAYDQETVYSSIDRQGRYAFGNQPSIALWNMVRFAESLLPLIAEDQSDAVAQAEEVLKTYGEQFESAYFKMLANKIGIENIAEQDRSLLTSLLETLQANKPDHTQTFALMGKALTDEAAATQAQQQLGEWYPTWRTYLKKICQTDEAAQAIMQATNPVVIPRNHHVEQVLADCEETGNTDSIETLLEVLRSPYKILPNTPNYQDSPEDLDKNYQTFCGT